jgi:hypothetical protein
MRETDRVGGRDARHHRTQTSRETLCASEERLPGHGVDPSVFDDQLEKSRMIYISPGYEEVWGRSRAVLTVAARLAGCDLSGRPPASPDAALIKQISGEYDEVYRIVSGWSDPLIQTRSRCGTRRGGSSTADRGRRMKRGLANNARRCSTPPSGDWRSPHAGRGRLEDTAGGLRRAGLGAGGDLGN